MRRRPSFTRLFFWLTGVTACWILTTGGTALGQGSKADYERALSLPARTEGKVFRSKVVPNWLPGNTQFWYRVESAPGVHEYIRVDAIKGTRAPAFDFAALDLALRAARTNSAGAGLPPLSNLELDPAGEFVRFDLDGSRWEFNTTQKQLTRRGELRNAGDRGPSGAVPKASRRTGGEMELQFLNRTDRDVELYWLDAQGARRSYGRLRPGQERKQHTFEGHAWLATDLQGTVVGIYEANQTRPQAVIQFEEPARPQAEPPPQPTEPAVEPGTSPDGNWIARIRDRNLVVERKTGGEPRILTRDGTGEDPYVEPVLWSPDSKCLVVMQRTEAEKHTVHIVESSPAGQIQPKLISLDYLKPGDRIAHPRPRLFEVASGRQIPIREELFSNPWDLTDLEWEPDSTAFSFVYNQRGHQVLRLVSVDAASGAVRTLVEESSKTFVDYAHKFHLTRLRPSGEVLWMSERSGWNHLYLVDAKTGRIRNPVTQGEWVVRRVESVDASARQVWFFAGGVVPGEDPYQLHLCRANFDGTGFVVLTQGDGSHSVQFSPDRRYFVDTWSRPDLAPVSVLRESGSGREVCALERGDWSRLLAAGWTVPERLTAVARDGVTPVYGILVKPSNFDPTRQYPVVEEVYAGPQGAYVPKEFGRLLRHHALAELGFIVVQVDGMGTSYRSKAFHDVCSRNLADAGFPDRKAWIRAAAGSRPWMDLSRVGIYGGSAGGQNAMRALLDHSDFYKVAVADCGCHDNRMDKIWWNELWLGWPVGDAYVKSSNVEDAAKLQGNLMLVVGELDSNVDPASTMQVVNALQKADKDCELVVVTGANHGAAETPYGSRRRMDFLVRHLHGKEPRWE